MLLMRPDAAHRVTVFGSTRKSAATSPGVRRRSLLPSTDLPLLISVSEHVFSVAKTSVYFLVFPKNEQLVFLVSFASGRADRCGGHSSTALLADLARCTRAVSGCAGQVPQVSRNTQRAITECARRY